jgi:hypothetical protein
MHIHKCVSMHVHECVRMHVHGFACTTGYLHKPFILLSPPHITTTHTHTHTLTHTNTHTNIHTYITPLQTATQTYIHCTSTNSHTLLAPLHVKIRQHCNAYVFEPQQLLISLLSSETATSQPFLVPHQDPVWPHLLVSRSCVIRVGQNHTCIGIKSVHTVL